MPDKEDIDQEIASCSVEYFRLHYLTQVPESLHNEWMEVIHDLLVSALSCQREYIEQRQHIPTPSNN